MSRATLTISTRKELYRRSRKLSERDAMRVLGYIDAIEEERLNKKTLAALQDADRIARIPPTKTYKSVDEMMKSIFADLQD